MSAYKGYVALYKAQGQRGESIVMGKKACWDYAVFFVKNEQPYLLNYFKNYDEALNNFIEKTAYTFGVKCSTVREYLSLFEEETGSMEIVCTGKEVM